MINFGIVPIGLTHLKMDRGNLIENKHVVKYKEIFTQEECVNKHIRVQESETINMSTSMFTVQYDKAKLYSIAEKVRGDPRYKVGNSTICNNIIKLKLNRRGCRGGVRMKSHLDITHPNGSDNDHLIT